MKVSARELVTRLETAKKIVPVEATFCHYKGEDITVTDLVITTRQNLSWLCMFLYMQHTVLKM